MLCHVAHGFLCYFLHVLLAWWLAYFSTPLTLSLLLPSFSLPQVALPNQSLLAMQLANQFFFFINNEHNPRQDFLPRKLVFRNLQPCLVALFLG